MNLVYATTVNMVHSDSNHFHDSKVHVLQYKAQKNGKLAH